jgi:hypothetical protein
MWQLDANLNDGPAPAEDASAGLETDAMPGPQSRVAGLVRSAPMEGPYKGWELIR